MSDYNKIIYFDSETISNILQESDKGIKTIKTQTSLLTRNSGEASAEIDIKFSVPFTKRLSFLISGKLNSSILKQYEKSTTLSSTEISEFERIKGKLIKFENVQIRDIENSSTFFRVAGGYLNIVKGGIDGVDVKEFNSVMQSYEGYDTYKLDGESKIYVRFNNSAFVSNYKRNDILTTKMNLYCIHVGDFYINDFDFIQQLNKMQTLISGVDASKTIADLYPLEQNEMNLDTLDKQSPSDNNVPLYDVIYASINVKNNSYDKDK